MVVNGIDTVTVNVEFTCEFVQIFCFTAVIEINAHERHQINLLFKSGRHLAGKSSDIHWRPEFAVHKLAFFSADISQIIDQLALFFRVNLTIRFCGLYHRSKHQRS
ncbi:MAG: hypothetical protein AAF412_09375, partial [Pseudomonadota bacterium]